METAAKIRRTWSPLVGAIRQVDEEPERPEKVEEKHGEAAAAEKDGKVEEKTWQDDTGIGDIYRYAFQHAWESAMAGGHTFKVLHHWEHFASLKEFLEYQAYLRQAMDDEEPDPPSGSKWQEQEPTTSESQARLGRSHAARLSWATALADGRDRGCAE